MCAKRAVCHHCSVTDIESAGRFNWRETTNVKPIKTKRDAKLDFCVGSDANRTRCFLSVIGHCEMFGAAI